MGNGAQQGDHPKKKFSPMWGQLWPLLRNSMGLYSILNYYTWNLSRGWLQRSYGFKCALGPLGHERESIFAWPPLSPRALSWARSAHRNCRTQFATGFAWTANRSRFKACASLTTKSLPRPPGCARKSRRLVLHAHWFLARRWERLAVSVQPTLSESCHCPMTCSMVAPGNAT